MTMAYNRTSIIWTPIRQSWMYCDHQHVEASAMVVARLSVFISVRCAHHEHCIVVLASNCETLLSGK